MHSLIQVSAWVLAAYGWVCFVRGEVALLIVILRELTGAYAGKGLGYFRLVSWILPARLCQNGGFFLYMMAQRNVSKGWSHSTNL
jgi:hypothetical protein